MPDRYKLPSATGDWHEAFAAMPLERPPCDGWPRLAAALARPPRTHRRLPWALAAAAAACLAALPLLPLQRPLPASTGLPASAARDTPPRDFAVASSPQMADSSASVAPPASSASGDTHLDHVHAESMRLEALLAELSATAPTDGMQLALSASLHSRMGEIDDALAGSDLDETTRAGLWRQRVALLRELVGVAADQRWNALYGDADADYALIQVY